MVQTVAKWNRDAIGEVVERVANEAIRNHDMGWRSSDARGSLWFVRLLSVGSGPCCAWWICRFFGATKKSCRRCRTRTGPCVGGVKWGTDMVWVEARGDPAFATGVAEKLEDALGREVTVTKTHLKETDDYPDLGPLGLP